MQFSRCLYWDSLNLRTSGMPYQIGGRNARASVHDMDIGEMGWMLSKCKNGHQSTCVIVITSSPISSIFRNASLSVSCKTPWQHPDHLCGQFKMNAITTSPSIQTISQHKYPLNLIPTFALPTTPLVVPASITLASLYSG